MEWLLWAALAVLGLVALPFVLGPFLVRFTVSQKAQPVFEPLDTESGQLPKEVYQHFLKTVEALKEDGFRICGYYRQEGQATNVTAYVALFVNEAQRDLAMAAGMYAELEGQPSLRTSYVEFCTELADGLELNTANTGELSPHAPVPERKGSSFPEIGDLRRLYQVHRALCARLGPAEKKSVPAEAELAARVAQDMVKCLEQQVAAGYYYLDGVGGCFRPTWKGAFLMTWKLCWPVTSIRKALRASRNAALLRELGV
jgi:hypothetical protein